MICWRTDRNQVQHSLEGGDGDGDDDWVDVGRPYDLNVLNSNAQECRQTFAEAITEEDEEDKEEGMDEDGVGDVTRDGDTRQSEGVARMRIHFVLRPIVRGASRLVPGFPSRRRKKRKGRGWLMGLLLRFFGVRKRRRMEKGKGKEKEKGKARPRLSNGSNTSGATRRTTTTTTSAATASPNKRKLLPFFQRLRRRTFILQERTLNNLSNRTDGSDVVLDSIYTISESEVSQGVVQEEDEERVEQTAN